MPTPSDFSAEPAVVIQAERGIHVMRFPTGKMDGQAVRQMYELTVHEISEPNARLMIDLSGVSYVSSAGLGMFLTLRKKCLGVGSQMHLFVPDPQVWDLFAITNLLKVLPLFRSREEALMKFKPPALAP